MSTRPRPNIVCPAVALSGGASVCRHKGAKLHAATCPGSRARRRLAASLPSGCGTDIRAELIKVLAGVLNVPIPERRLIGCNEHPDEDEAAHKGDDEQDQPHR